MKIFADAGSKVNFIDENDVFVGYDLTQDCCEHADWFIEEKVTAYDFDMKLNQPTDLPDYRFDRSFFQRHESGELDSGAMVIFKLVAPDKPDLYLHLFNAHNGYYGHGFEVKTGGQDGQLQRGEAL